MEVKEEAMLLGVVGGEGGWGRGLGLDLSS